MQLVHLVATLKGGLLTLLAVLTFAQNGLWTDEARLWRNAARHAPLKPRPFINLGRALEAAGDDLGAKLAYERAIDLSYEKRRESLTFAFAHAAAQTNLAHLYAKHDQPGVSAYLLEAVLKEQPLFPVAIYNKSALLAREGKCAEARVQRMLAQSLDPTLPAGMPCEVMK